MARHFEPKFELRFEIHFGPVKAFFIKNEGYTINGAQNQFMCKTARENVLQIREQQFSNFYASGGQNFETRAYYQWSECNFEND